MHEATFSKDGLFAMTDTLVKRDDGYDDLGFQYYAISKAIKINKAYVCIQTADMRDLAS